jgi:hypothetical protein
MIRFILAFKNNISGGSASGNVTIPSTSNFFVTGIVPIDDEEYSDDYFNYLYVLKDNTVTGNNRVWTHGLDYLKICCDTESSTDPNKCTWVIIEQDDGSKLFMSNGEFENPWDVTSWICNETIAKGNPNITIPKIEIIVTDCDANEANGSYVLRDSTQTGKDRRWINMDSPDIEIWYEYGEWVVGDDGGYIIAGARSDADDPVSAINWEAYEEEYEVTIAPTLAWANRFR